MSNPLGHRFPDEMPLFIAHGAEAPGARQRHAAGCRAFGSIQAFGEEGDILFRYVMGHSATSGFVVPPATWL
jgi:hypothetical protein